MSELGPPDCTGVVLAGGLSSRMGREKAALLIGGEPLLRRVLARVRAALGAALVVGPESLRALVPGERVEPDRDPGAGPLAGLVTALSLVETSSVFLVACDMPFLAPELVRAMALAASEPPLPDATLLRGAHGLEYLHGVYSASCLPRAERLLAGGQRSLRALAMSLRVRDLTADWAARYDPEGLSTFNANTPADWERACGLASAECGFGSCG